MKLAHEILILTLETIALLLVSAGLGAFTGWWFGTAGLLTVTGLCLFIFASLAAWRQQSMSAPPKSATTNTGRR